MIEVARLDNETLQPTGETIIHPQQSIVEFVGRMSRMGWEQQLISETDGWKMYRFTLGSGGRNPLPKDRWQISHRAIRELNGREPEVPPASVTETLKIMDAKLLDEPAEPVAEPDTSVEPYELPEAPAAVTERPGRRLPIPSEWTPEARIHAAERFLADLMAPYGQAPGLTCEIRSSDPAAPEAGWISKPFGMAPAFIRRAAEYAVEISADQNVYVGVLPRMGRSGSARSVTRAAWLWVELDLADGTPEQLRALIRRAGVLATPRLFVQSGSGGGHLYYPLDVVCELPGDDDRERFSDVLRGLVEAINEVAPFGGASVHVDYRDEKGKRAAANIAGAHADPACVDVARILRIPGTLNHKSDPPRPVKMFWAEKEPHSAEWWKGKLPFRSLPLGAEPRSESPGDAAGNERVDPAQTGGVVAHANSTGGTTHGYALDGDVCVGDGGTASGPGAGAAPGEGQELPTADEPPGAGADRADGSTQVLLSNGHAASRYQADILRFQEMGDGHGLVTAVAGSGKTTTLVEMSKRRGMHERGRALFVAFNKHIADELAGRLPSGVEARTIHSMGYRCLANVVEPPAKETWINANKYRVLARAYVKQEGMNSFKRRDLVDALDQAVSFTMYTLSPVGDVDALQGIVDHYGLELPQDYPIERLAEGVRTLITWGRDGSPDGEFAGLRQSVSYDELVYYPATMDISLPRYQTLYVDESQDLNAMQREMVLRLLDPGRGRAMFVGDPRQCQPAGTMVTLTGGKTVPIECVSAGDEVVSFDRRAGVILGLKRHGRKVLRSASRLYDEPILKVATSANATLCTPNHRWIARFTDRTPDINVVYLMRQGDWYRVGWCQLFEKNGNLHLAQRARIEKADAAWILSVHNDKTTASVAESIVAASFGLPTMPFEPVNGANHITAEAITTVFSSIPSIRRRAEGCLIKHGRLLDHPFYSRSERQRQGRTTIFETAACNLLSSIMAIPVHTGCQQPTWEPVSVTRDSDYAPQMVYSLEIEGTGTYIADGLVTHNSIYGFSGADTDSVERIADRTKPRRLPLSICYRCPRTHVQLAQEIVPEIEPAPGAPDGELVVEKASHLRGLVVPGDLVLCRTTAPLINACFDLIRAGVPAQVRGRDIGRNLARTVETIENGTLNARFDMFLGLLDSYTDVQLRMLLQREDNELAVEALMDRTATLRVLYERAYGEDGVREWSRFRAYIEAMFGDEGGNLVTLSTVHRAKGLEADHVLLLRPELMPHPKARRAWEVSQEQNLRYVALTRSRRRLTILETDEAA